MFRISLLLDFGFRGSRPFGRLFKHEWNGVIHAQGFKNRFFVLDQMLHVQDKVVVNGARLAMSPERDPVAGQAVRGEHRALGHLGRTFRHKVGKLSEGDGELDRVVVFVFAVLPLKRVQSVLGS